MSTTSVPVAAIRSLLATVTNVCPRFFCISFRFLTLVGTRHQSKRIACRPDDLYATERLGKVELMKE